MNLSYRIFYKKVILKCFLWNKMTKWRLIELQNNYKNLLLHAQHCINAAQVHLPPAHCKKQPLKHSSQSCKALAWTASFLTVCHSSTHTVSDGLQFLTLLWTLKVGCDYSSRDCRGIYFKKTFLLFWNRSNCRVRADHGHSGVKLADARHCSVSYSRSK